MNSENAWQATLGQLQMEMPKASFDTWVRSSELVSYSDQTFVIGVHNAYARDWLESRLTSTVSHMLSGIMNQPQKVRFIVYHRESENPDKEENSLSQYESPARDATFINSRYAFDSFVVGSCNRMAHAASLAVAESPAKAYNPLYIYGGVGLGKTHLLCSIGNEALKHGLRVLYVSSEEFTNDLINSIRTHTTTAFRDRYRNMDVLLVDDIQFIAGKESTQEEFFHTFNALHTQNKQVVISSDRPPKALVTLEERLRSRFDWGLCVDIQPPDLETRIAILRSKSELSGRHVPAGILESIARQIQSNVRELEGALTRVLAYADLRGEEITPSLVQVALADMLPTRRELEPRQVIQAAADVFGLKVENLLNRTRTHDIAEARQVVMYLLREEAGLSLLQIGTALGGRDHTTVMYACEKIGDRVERDDLFRRQVSQVRERLSLRN